MRTRIQKLALSALASLWALSAQTPSSVTLTFEGLKDGEGVANYYNGGLGASNSGPGPNYGVTFGPTAQAGIDADGKGSLASNASNAPSGVTVVFFGTGTSLVMNVANGFTGGFSFYYAAPAQAGSIAVYDGLNGTGNLLKSISLPITQAYCNSLYAYSCWIPVNATFTGTAKSVNFGGAANYIGFDNITLGPNVNKFLITTFALPPGTVGTNYSATLATTGGTGAVTWTATGLPQGMTINPQTGAITGNPTTANTYTVNVTATDSSTPTKLTYTSQFQLLINPKFSITTTALPPGTVGSLYSTTLTGQGGVTPYTWSATGLPSGFSINPQTGVISGTPTVATSYPINVTLFDNGGEVRQTATMAFTLVINPKLTITTTSLLNGLLGAAYSQTVQASGGTTPYKWSTGTGLPPGLGINPQTGAITGVPAGTATGTYPFTVTVTDSSTPSNLTASANLSITIGSGLTITTTSLNNGTVGAAYNQTLQASGGTTPYAWTATGLPGGLSINTQSGAISGTPTTATTTPATVNVTVTDNLKLTATKSFQLTINPATLTITTTSLNNGAVGAAYNQTVQASGGTTPYAWTATGLPAGLSINSQSGAITGTPTTATTSPATVNVTVTDNLKVTSNKSFQLTINPALTITTTGLNNGTVGAAYNQTVQASGGTTPYSWTATGLPAGLSINTQSGAITGTPTAATTAPATVNIAVTDSLSLTASKSLQITIVAGLAITTTSLNTGVVGSAYNQTIQASGGTAPYSWTATGLPGGLSINTQSGAISGTPTTATTTPATVNVTVTDNLKLTATKSFQLTINAGLSITTTALNSGTVGVTYNQTIQAAGGTSPYTWSASGLPAGLTISTAGVISGTPTTATTTPANVVLTVTDNAKASVSKTLPLTIASKLTITTTSIPSAFVNATYTPVTLAASGGSGSGYTWTATGLPPGMSISAAGVLGGIPAAAASYPAAFTVKDSASNTATATLTITVIPAIQLTAVPGQVVTISANLGAPTPTPMTATLSLSFSPLVSNLPNLADPGLQFAQGGLSTTVAIPQGSTTASLPANNGIQTGSVAGTITVTLTKLTQTLFGVEIPISLPSPNPSTTITVAKTAPAISSVKIVNITSTGFAVDIVAMSNALDLTNANLTFTSASGTQLNGTTFTVSLASAYTDFLTNKGGAAFGSSFDVQIPFTYSGDTTALGTVSVTLQNSAGTSAALPGGR